MSFRIGHGFDVHRFGEGDHLMIGGVRLPFDRGFVAHSDGDVLLAERACRARAGGERGGQRKHCAASPSCCRRARSTKKAGEYQGRLCKSTK